MNISDVLIHFCLLGVILYTACWSIFYFAKLKGRVEKMYEKKCGRFKPSQEEVRIRVRIGANSR